MPPWPWRAPRSAPCHGPTLIRPLFGVLLRTGEPSQSRVSAGQVSPRRRRDQAGLAAPRSIRSLSIDLNFDHEPRKLLSSKLSHETSLPSLPTSLTVNCELLAAELQWHFSAPLLNQRSPQSPRSTAGWVGRGSRSSRCPIVVVVSLFVLERNKSRRHDFVPNTLAHFPSSATDRGAFEYTPGRSGWVDMWLECE